MAHVLSRSFYVCTHRKFNDRIRVITESLRQAANSSITDNAAFAQISGNLPGESSAEKRTFIIEAVDRSAEWIGRFVAEKGLTQEAILSDLNGVLNVTDGGLDYVAAALDASTNYMLHTGTQTVARSLAVKALEEVQTEVWERWIAEQG